MSDTDALLACPKNNGIIDPCVAEQQIWNVTKRDLDAAAAVMPTLRAIAARGASGIYPVDALSIDEW